MEDVKTSAAEPVTCKRCGRKLTAAASVATRLGKVCAVKEALEGLTGKQRDEVMEMAADGAPVQVREGIWKVPSGDGQQVYTTTPEGHCNCKWGLRRTSAHVKVCKHAGLVRFEIARRSRLMKAA